MLKFTALLQLVLFPFLLSAQTIDRLEQFPFAADPLVLHHTAQPQQPFTVVGEHGAILGTQDGRFELWLMPVQIFRNARLTARLQGYETEIALNSLASDVEVAPDHTTITYSHAAISVRQHMFVFRSADGAGEAIVLFEVHATRPAEITLHFDPTMTMQWPAPGFGPASVSWATRPQGSGYLLETNRPDFYGAVAMPGARRGDLRPYQERAEQTPVVFTFDYVPGRDDHRFYPLLCGVSQVHAPKTSSEQPHATEKASPSLLLDRVLAAEQKIPALYNSTAEFYAHFFDTRFQAETPDGEFDRAVRWSEIAIEQLQTPLPQGVGLTAGWLLAGATARPGYGWFFGRDTLWTLFAVNSYGNFQLSRDALEFLLSQQRDDGKIMHELSQTASWVDWKSMPYFYAAADSTPLFLMATDDYVRSSGDASFLRTHWQQILQAYRFTRSHTTNGAMNNAQGTGWVEEWLPHPPDQEAYLVALDAQANLAMVRMASAMGDARLAADAQHTTDAIQALFNTYRSPAGLYRFSRNRDGSFDEARSIFPSVAWWTGELHPTDPTKTFADWESNHFTVDWGIRSVADDQAIYDPISYHHGSVWPLYAGWIAMAEFHTGRPSAAYEHLRAEIGLTKLQDPGAITELLSGEFYEPLARSSSHQLWSSAMFLTPAIRGLFGLSSDAFLHRLTVAPQLPAGWNHLVLNNVDVGTQRFRIRMDKVGMELIVDATSDTPAVLCMSASSESTPCEQKPALHHGLRIPLPPVEIGLENTETREGMRSQHMHVLGEQRDARSLTLILEAPAGTTQTLKLYRNTKPGNALALHVEGGTIQDDQIAVHMPLGNGYQTIPITIRW
jgi:glycogen debranching enzyme